MRVLVDYEALEPSRAHVKAKRSLPEAIQKYQRAQGNITEHNHFDYKPIIMTRHRLALPPANPACIKNWQAKAPAPPGAASSTGGDGQFKRELPIAD
jgi:hypothetical protein